MSTIENQHALQEVKHDIIKKDFTKARLVMEHFPEICRTEQDAILRELNKATDEFAIPVLSYLLIKYPEVTTQFPDIKRMIRDKATRSPNIVVEGLASENPERIHYLKLAGELDLQEAVPNLISLILSIEDKTAQLTTLSSLGALGNPQAINAVSEFLYVDDCELLIAAITTMGRFATPSAIQHLSNFLGRDSRIDRLILDVFAEVQDDLSLRRLVDSLESRSAPVRNHARSWLLAIGGNSVPLLVSNLSSSNNDLQILSLNILQEIGDENSALAIRKLINNHPPNPNVRFAAFEALAELSNRKGDFVLAGGIVDHNSNVRLAAAKAIDRNLDESLIAGVMNMVQNPGNEAEQIVKAVIDAQAGKLFMGLKESQRFRERASIYLGREVHPDVRHFFINLLTEEGASECADEILRQVQDQKNQIKGRVCAVDDSKMILNIYRSIMTELGFDVILFSEPLEAISWLQKEKPDFLCTDLNMPGITGIELIQQVREIYSKDELPVILITTQDEAQDNKAAKEAGVNEIMYKPFNTEMVSELFAKITSSPMRAGKKEL